MTKFSPSLSANIETSSPKTLFDHYFFPCLAEHLVFKDLTQREESNLPGFAHDHPFPRRQAIGLHDEGPLHVLDEALSIFLLTGRKDPVRGRGNPVALHEILGKRFASFELGGHLCGPENRHPVFAEEVHDSQNERLFGAHHREVNLLFLRKLEQGANVSSFHTSSCSRPPEPMTRIFISRFPLRP